VRFLKIIKVLSLVIRFFGKAFSYVFSYSFISNLNKINNKLYSAWISKEFRNMGKSSVIQRHMHLIGGKYISIGTNTGIGVRAVLTAWDKYKSNTFEPTIIIGNNVSIGDDCHITAINRIEIGNNVLTGKKITITDNSHGKSNLESILLSPSDRTLHSAGPVIIEDGVWIGDKVTILPNVRIGKSSIIGANSVVTKNIPSNCVAAGIPAKVIKTFE
jgi:acetyltransferase-like isoleucine patch superfamily enzyme